VRSSTGLNILQPRADAGGDGAAVLAGQHQGGADDDFAAGLAGRTQPRRLTDDDRGDVRDPDHRRAATAHRCLGQLAEGLHPGVGADDIGLAAARDIARALNPVGVFQRIDQLRQTDAEGRQLGRIRLHHILLHIAAQNVDPSDALEGLQLRRDDPVLDRSQIGRLLDVRGQTVALGRYIDRGGSRRRARQLDGPDIDLAQAGDRRSHAGLQPVGQVGAGGLKPLVDQTSRQIEVGGVGEDSGDLREAVA
jgi:hypothetical protein